MNGEFVMLFFKLLLKKLLSPNCSSVNDFIFQTFLGHIYNVAKVLTSQKNRPPLVIACWLNTSSMFASLGAVFRP